MFIGRRLKDDSTPGSLVHSSQRSDTENIGIERIDHLHHLRLFICLQGTSQVWDDVREELLMLKNK